MENGRLGTVFVEINLDKTKFEKEQQRLLDDIKKIGEGVEGNLTKSFQNLGVKTDNVYQLMANKALRSYEMISQSANTSAAEQLRAAQAYASKLESINKDKFKYEIAATEKAQQISSDYWTKRLAFEKQATKESEQITADYWMRKMAFEKQAIAQSNQANAGYWLKRMAFEKTTAQQAAQQSETMWKTMGIRPTSAIEADKAAVLASYATLSAAAKGNHQELINLERAKNDQLKKLNAEMVGEHEMSMASMTRAVLRFYAAYYVISAVIQAVSSAFQAGMKIVEDYNQSVASLAAMVVTFSERGRGVSLEQQWDKALKYSTAMVPVLEEIAAKTILSGVETTALANAFARSGVFLDGNNQKQIESFTRISNALPLMTQGQEIMRQINTEIRSLMTGSNESSSMMLQTLKAIDPQIKEHLKTWREQGTVLENIGVMLEGFGPATKILEMQWTAVKTTLSTTVDQILRGAMQAAYEDIIALVKEMDKWLKANKATIQEGIVTAWELTKGVVGSVWGLLEGFGPVLKKLAEYTMWSAQGWALIFAVVKPIGEAIGRLVEKAYFLGEMLVQVAKIAINPFGDTTESLAAFQKARNEFDKINEKSMLTEIDGNLYAVNKTIEAYKNGEKAKTDAADLSIGNRMNSLEAFKKAEESLDAKLRLEQSTNATIVKENELNALKDRLRGQREYKDKLKAYGEEAAEAWINADSARILAEQKKEDKSNLKDAASAYREYEKSIKDVTDEYYRLTMAEDEATKRKIWENWEGQAAKMSDYALAARDLALQEVDLHGKVATARQKGHEEYETMMSHEYEFASTTKEREANKLIALEAIKLNKIKELQALGAISIQEAADAELRIRKNADAAIFQKAIESAIAISKIKLEYTQSTEGPNSDAYQKAFEERVRLDAQLAEMTAKSQGVEIDQNKLVTAKLNEELATRLDATASYYNSINGMEEKASFFAAAAIEIRKKLDTTAYGDQIAAAKKAQQSIDEQAIKSGSFSEGWRAALNQSSEDFVKWGKKGKDTFDAIYNSGKSSISDGLFNMLKGDMNGFLSAWNSFCDAILKKYTDLLADMAMNSMSNAFKGAGNLFTWFGFGSSSGYTEIGADPTGMIPASANGNVFSGPGISAYENQIISEPTIFPFARGMGLMGESGAEAIMPLTRTSDGKLGVKADGSASSRQNVTINVNSNTGVQMSQKPKISFDAQGMVVSLWLDAFDRNVNGLRSALGAR